MSTSSTSSLDGSDLSGFESDSSSASSALSASASASSGHLPHGPITLTQPPQLKYRKQIASSQPTQGVVYRPTLEPRSHSQPTFPILHAGRFIRDLLPFKFSPTSSPSAVSLRSCTTSPYPSGSKLPLATVVLPSTPPSASSKGAPAVVVVNPTPHPTPPATPRVPDELPSGTQATVSSLPYQGLTSAPSLRVPSPVLPMIPPNPAPEGVDTTRPSKLFYLSQATPQQSPDSTSSGTGTTTTTSGTRNLHPPSDAPARLRDGSIASSGPYAAGASSSRSRSPGDDSLVVGSATSARSRGSAGSAVRRGGAGKNKDLRHAVGGSRSARAAFTPRSTLQNRAAARAATLPSGKASGAVLGHASGAALGRTDNALTSRDLAPAAALPYTEPPRQLTSAAAARDAAVPVAGARSNVPITPTQAPMPPRITASPEGIQPVASASGSGIARAPEAWTSNLAQAQTPMPPQQQRTSTLFTTLLKPTRNKVELESSEDDSSEQEDDSWTEESDHEDRPPARGRTNAARSTRREPSVVNEASQELERQVELVKKLPHRSWSNLDRLQPTSGLLTHLFRPDLVRSGLPHHSMSSDQLSGMGGRGGAMPQMRRGHALQPLTQAVIAQPTLSAHQPQRRNIVPPTSPQQQQQQQQQQQLPRTGYQPRARPVDEDIETDSDDDPDDAVHVSESMAQQRLHELARRHQHQRRTSPLQQQLETAAPSQFVRKTHPAQVSPPPPPPPLPPAEPIPVMINHAMLPIPLPAVSPRTTRRNMMASEMSESLRHNLLRERQVAKRSLGVQRNTSAQDLPMVNERGQPLTEREIASRAAIQRNKSFQGPFMPGGL